MSALYLYVALGGAVGSVARFAVSNYAARVCGETFPWGTLVANVTGSFVIGFLATLTSPEGRWLMPAGGRAFFMAGVCGGYTTFSSFSLQTLALAQDGEWWKAGANTMASVILCLAAVWLGHLVALKLNTLKGS